MAGIGRRTLYRKSVMDSYLNELPELEEGQMVAEVKAPRGSNLMEILCSNGEESLAMLPTKFRKLIWVKRGDYVIVSGSSGDVTTATGEDGKVKYSIAHILSQDHIQELRKNGMWPDIFCNSIPNEHSQDENKIDSTDQVNESQGVTDEEDNGDDEAQDDLYAFMKMDNPNHRVQQHYYDDSESEEEDEENEEP
mmetsp:Transcript_13666/g.17485  ORF Transcript_13666/g.17485 Transcript_13666/m.17485 type:complete len:194 (+) Transcript_13666:151-732(+)